MTNMEIILGAMLEAELDPEEVEVDTFAGWKRRGFIVKRGQKAVFQTKIWKPCKFKEEDEKTLNIEEDAKHNTNRLILVNASFFTDGQVERSQK